MNQNWQDYVVSVVSKNENNKSFGSGFIFFQDKSASYVLTCAHVLSDVGGINHARINGRSVKLVASGEEEDIDLVVLQVERLNAKAPATLNLQAQAEQGTAFVTAGFQLFDKKLLIRSLRGKLGKQTGLESRKQEARIKTWDIDIVDEDFLQPGYSGAPVLDELTGGVIGIVSHRQGSGRRGFAISATALNLVWPEIVAEYPSLRVSMENKRNIHLLINELNTSHQNWEGAPDVSSFFGRNKELSTLKKWILEDQCRLVAVVGIRGVGKTRLSVKLGRGGVGKTDLSLKLAKGIQDEFEFVIWRRLLNAPPLKETLADLVKFLSEQTEINLPEATSNQITRLLYYLRSFRCLIILDNVETILDDHEGYGELFRRVGRTSHQSCLLINSRKMPQEVARLEGVAKPVRVLHLGGLDLSSGRKIVEEVGEFSGTDKDWKNLIEYYNGNPLALELAARHIASVFFGDISEFLNQGKPFFDDLSDLLSWHIERLSYLEKELMYWFAIEREPISFSELKENILPPQAKDRLSSTLQSLQRLIPLEKSMTRFTLQPVLLEYMTEQLIQQVGGEIETEEQVLDYVTQHLVSQVSDEIKNGEINLLNTHSLLKATSKAYVRESQIRLILLPIIERLVAYFGSLSELEDRLLEIISRIRDDAPRKPGYAAGNVLNLLCQFKDELQDYNFSELVIWQAYLQGKELKNINFSRSVIERSVFTEAFGSIPAVSFSPNGKLLAVATAGGEIRVWRTFDFKHILTCVGHTDWVRSVTFSPDSKIMASGSGDQTIFIWSTLTGERLKVLRGHTGQVWSVEFNPDGNILASGSDDNTIHLWNPDTGELIRVLEGHNSRVKSIKFSSDGSMLASGSGDHTVRLWDIQSGECLKILSDSASPVWSVALDPNGEFLASGTQDHKIQLWDIASGKNIRTLIGHVDVIWSLDFSSDGKLLASGSHDNTIRIWDPRTGKTINVLDGHTNWVESVAFSPDGNLLASSSDDQTVRVWDVQDFKCLRTLQGYTNPVWSVAFSPDDSKLASGNSDNTVRLWNLQNGQPLGTLRGHTNWVWSVAFNPDGDTLASGSGDQTIRLWDLKTNRSTLVLRGHTGRVRSITFNHNGQMLVSGGGDNTIRTWDPRTGKTINVLDGHTNWVESVAFSPDGNLLASSSDDQTVRVWDVTNAICLKIFRGHTGQVWSVAFDSDTKMLASGGGHNIRLWDLESFRALTVLEGHTNRVRSISFNPTGRYLASGSQDNSVRLWDLETQTCIKTLLGHSNAVRSVAFNRDGSRLASCGEDETIKIWETSTFECIRTIRCERPYEGLNIHEVEGLTTAQKATLTALGAISSPT